MDVSDLLTFVLVVLGIATLLGIAAIGLVMWRFRIGPRGLAAMVGALVYLASPVDAVPEVILGPLGLLDDAGAVTLAAVFVHRIITVRKRLDALRQPDRDAPPSDPA